MGTHGDDYDPWKAAAVLYSVAETAERLARIRGTVAASLRRLGRLRKRAWPTQQAEQVQRHAEQARAYARNLRLRAERLTGVKPWHG
ncbi:MAG: hypothetical protein AUI14_07885 [Actinobacteria bacterium 13_2_20CM_2_71_6]|nr:MAG: hypothetical protein AUI14_07885 [Actinobacteria bacterium 13_2_20CM_2_71_6]